MCTYNKFKLKKDNWKKDVVSYAENILFGNSIRTFYNKNKEIVYCENSSIDRDELLKGLKRLYHKDLTPNRNNQRKRSFKGKKSANK